MSKARSDLFIVDNSDADWKVSSYLKDWCELSSQIDIATGYFEIGAFLALGEGWQKVDKIRLLMGDEVSLRTKLAFEKGLQKITAQLDDSLEQEKRRNDFLKGVPAIIEGIRSGRIECRVYRKDKFHAKCYITHGRLAVVGSFALVGSSNFTAPGLSQNIELNVQIRGPEVGLLQDWYETHWNDAEDVTADILQTLERHTEPHTPFEIWFKSLHEYLRAHELTPDEWDKCSSKVFPLLGGYQRDAYKNMMDIAGRYGCAFLCDGVGLGKTFVGLMLIERMLKENKRVVLFAPKAAREDVWEIEIERRLPDTRSGFINLKLYNHTDLQRTSEKFQTEITRTIADADVIIIDEAHHFRNSGVAGTGVKAPSRYRKLQSYIHQPGSRPKSLFFLTATPINNSVHDFRRILELVTHEDDGYFSRDEKNLGIHSLRRYFVDLEKNLFAVKDDDPESSPGGIDEHLLHESLFERLVVQRSRAFVKESEKLQENQAPTILFPERQAPQVAEYKLKTTYGRLLEEVETAFDRETPLFNLDIYNPLEHWIGPKDDPTYADAFNKARQAQVVSLIRTQFLKRFESSSKAFEMSCYRLLKKLYAWVNKNIAKDDSHNLGRLQRWKIRHDKLINFVNEHQLELWNESDAGAPTEDFLTDEELQDAEELDPNLYDIDKILDHTFEDLDQLARFLELVAKVEPSKDDKLSALKKLAQGKALSGKKVLLFTEFADTARYLEQQLTAAGIEGIERIDGGSTQQRRTDCIRRFAPYYNGSDSAEVASSGKQEIRMLIATDILAEGLNLQDASHLINYDIHWNPVRLMQRIGRVDRRMNPAIEARIAADHPGLARGKVFYWNFLPPDELDELLRLYNRVSGKTRMISKTLGVDTGKLLRGDDDFDEIRDINKLFDGKQSDVEKLRIEYQTLVRDHPELAAKLDTLPLKIFTGRAHPTPGTKALFLCYRIPGPDKALQEAPDDAIRWSESAGYTVWLLFDPEGNIVTPSPDNIANVVRSAPDTPDLRVWRESDLKKLREKAEELLNKQHLKPLQAPIGVFPVLKCWMELS